jgi:hypothetical protein
MNVKCTANLDSNVELIAPTFVRIFQQFVKSIFKGGLAEPAR